MQFSKSERGFRLAVVVIWVFLKKDSKNPQTTTVKGLALNCNVKSLQFSQLEIRLVGDWSEA